VLNVCSGGVGETNGIESISRKSQFFFLFIVTWGNAARLKRGESAEITTNLLNRGGRYADRSIIYVTGTWVLITARQIGGFASNANVGTIYRLKASRNSMVL